MNKHEEAVEYLRAKLQRVNINNPKANAGGVLLLRLHKNLEEDLSLLIGIARHAIQHSFSRGNNGYNIGETPLTATSMSIGERVGSLIQRDPLEIRHQLALGDLLIECLYNVGMITLDYDRRPDSKHMIKAGLYWHKAEWPEELDRILLGKTVYKKPEDISGTMLTVNDLTYPLIKGLEDDVELDLYNPWVTAANKLNQQGWKVNERVKIVLDLNKDYYIDEFSDTSKRAEWDLSRQNFDKLILHDVFYQYVDFDYRGRVYYKESYTHFQGADISRGLLLFEEGKPLTESGLYWLAIHTASSFNQSYGKDEIPEWCEEDYRSYLESEELDDISVDKMTPNDRVLWTINHMDMIRDIAQNHRFPVDAEKEASFLACCYEWDDYHSDPDNHLSYLPIPIDGSNNGWQHLGAISKDSQTGMLVGLIDVDIQQDFYVQTAKQMLKLVDGEVKDTLDDMPMKYIRKGISKRASMTRAYSAGAMKMADSMWSDCRKEGYDKKYGITEKQCKALGNIMVKAISETCPGPLKTMKYLQELAMYQLGEFKAMRDGEIADKEYKALISKKSRLWKKSNKTEEDLMELSRITEEIGEYKHEMIRGNGAQYLEWTSPSGFPVVYKKWKMIDQKIRARIGGYGQVKHVVKVATDKPDEKGFMSGISPNYIHSMDAAHLALVVANWEGSFGAVHDSFSTHASDVDELLALTKQTFIDMYNSDNFFDEIRKQITDSTDDVEQPELGDLDIGGVNDSKYFFL